MKHTAHALLTLAFLTQHNVFKFYLVGHSVFIAEYYSIVFYHLCMHSTLDGHLDGFQFLQNICFWKKFLFASHCLCTSGYFKLRKYKLVYPHGDLLLNALSLPQNLAESLYYMLFFPRTFKIVAFRPQTGRSVWLSLNREEQGSWSTIGHSWCKRMLISLLLHTT